MIWFTMSMTILNATYIRARSVGNGTMSMLDWYNARLVKVCTSHHADWEREVHDQDGNGVMSSNNFLFIRT